MDRRERAIELKHHGHNCCQAVLCAFADQVDLPEETLDAMGACFGGVMGRMEGTCGALVAAQMLTGLTRFEGKPLGRDARANFDQFQEACGVTLCKDLKGRDTGVVLCACDDCIRNAVSIAEQLFANA